MLSKFIRYTQVADSLVIDTFLNSDKNIPQAEALFSHILNAQCIWYSRLNHEESPYKVFQLHDLKTMLKLAGTTSRSLCYWLEALHEDNLANSYTYTNTQGKTYTNTVREILTHVVNHATYHRAQIATDMRLHGLEPVVTDYIAYARELNGEL